MREVRNDDESALLPSPLLILSEGATLELTSPPYTTPAAATMKRTTRPFQPHTLCVSSPGLMFHAAFVLSFSPQSAPSRGPSGLPICLVIKARRHWPGVSGGHTLNVLAVIVGVSPWFVPGVDDLDAVEDNVLHGVRRVGAENSRAGLRSDHSDVAQGNICIGPGSGGVALGGGDLGPANGARVGGTEAPRVGLLGRADPDCPLGWLINDDVFVGHICDTSRRAAIPELHIDALVSVVHVAISKRNVPHHTPRNGANGQPNTTGIDPLKEHVFGSIFDSNAVVLVPDVAVMDPNVLPRNVEAVRVESRHV
mmetsp:Transcript_14817/g.43921  ORF Transcript_14817/g.43921 Transcript_14817/m.43921 type:complete len:310 (-) Transcript_14817:652-1581(-)